MINQLFTWESWDLIDETLSSYEDCVFVKDVGKYKIGDKVSRIDVDTKSSLIEIYDTIFDILRSFAVTYGIELHVYELD